jgi:phosphohistidine phosphatase
MKHLYLLRHGLADHDGPPTWTHDSRRPLTDAGIERMREEARGMKALGLAIDTVVTSPYVRCRQTADAVAGVYRLADRLVEADPMEPGAGFADLRKALRGVEGTAVLVVGHAPDLGLLVGDLTGAVDVELGKGWLAWIRIPGEIEKGGGRLKALLPAELLAAAGRLAAD